LASSASGIGSSPKSLLLIVRASSSVGSISVPSLPVPLSSATGSW